MVARSYVSVTNTRARTMVYQCLMRPGLYEFSKGNTAEMMPAIAVHG